MHPRNVLLFPALLLEAAAIKPLAAERGEHIIAAASDPDEAGFLLFPDHHVLPRVLEDGFAEALHALVVTQGVQHIYCPHDRCYNIITNIIKKWQENITLSSGLQQFHAEFSHDTLCEAIAPFYAAQSGRVMRRPIIPLDHLAALLKPVTAIVGQSHGEKLTTLGALAADWPEGDCVEIGVASGRSAVFLTLLMQYFNLGKTLAVDPWTSADAAQNINVLDETLSVDKSAWERGLKVFTRNMLPYARHDVAFLRLQSVAAYERYCAERVLGDAPFAGVKTLGKIALLHIDGNHEFSHVAEDLRLWTTRLLPGAWLVVDDYVWAYGDGPQRAADAWLAENKARVAEFFVVGRAMFIKMKEETNGA